MIGKVIVQIPGEPEQKPDQEYIPCLLHLRDYNSDAQNHGSLLYDQNGNKGKGEWLFILCGSSPSNVIAFAEKVIESAKADFNSPIVKL